MTLDELAKLTAQDLTKLVAEQLAKQPPDESAKQKVEQAEELKDVQAVMERYQSFGSELLRISLLGVALLAFFIDKMAGTTSPFPEWSKILMFFSLGVAAFLFAMSAAAALGNRYYLAEAGYYLVRVLIARQLDNTLYTCRTAWLRFILCHA